MPALWERHEFTSDELAFWGREIFEAALEVPEHRRVALVDTLCAGSDRLRRYCEALLANSWSDVSVASFAGALSAGDLIQDCVVLRPIGRGGMGEVYKAIQRPLRRLVAVKVVTSGRATASFEREAVTAASVVHPNIVSVYDASLDAASPCVVMEYVEGITLREYLARRHSGDISPDTRTIRSIIRQAAQAVGEAHRRGLIHRDLKPENILVVKRETDFIVKVVDFGLARRIDTPAGPAVGTAGYMAPEVLSGSSSDSRLDLFALGVVLFELVTGEHPFTGRSDAETHFNTINREPAFPGDGACTDLVAIARRAMQKHPDRRYQSVAEFTADLDSRLEHRPRLGLNPFLSELPVPVQWWWTEHSSGFFVALLSLAWGLTTLVLSVVNGAACVRVTWTAESDPGRTMEMIYGYAVESNAGLWYVIGTSICFVSGFALLEAMHRGLARTPALSIDGGRADPLRNIAQRNRKVFRVVLPLVSLSALAFVGGPEFSYRETHAFGWVQTDLAPRQLGKTYQNLRAAGKIGDVPALSSLCEGCEIRVTAVANRTTGFEQPARVAYAVFLVIALGHQMVLTAFVIWIVFKILFVFGLMSMALVGEARGGLRLIPDLQDRDDYRFGLGQLDHVYYAILALVSAGALGLFLQAAANVSKGTYFLAGDPAPALFGQAVLLFGTIALLTIVLTAPITVFLVLTIKVVGDELGHLSARRKALDTQLSTARSEAEREHLRREIAMILERRALARKQSLLPIRRPAFLILLTANLAMLVLLPATIQWLGTPSSSKLSLTQRWSNAICVACGNAPSLRR
jgi:hypothetical protein